MYSLLTSDIVSGSVVDVSIRNTDISEFGVDDLRIKIQAKLVADLPLIENN